MTNRKLRALAGIICGRIGAKEKPYALFVYESDGETRWFIKPSERLTVEDLYDERYVSTYNPQTLTVDIVLRDLEELK